RGSGGTQLVGAINARSGRRLGVETVATRSNEIPAGQTLLDRLELDGTIALMDERTRQAGPSTKPL
ncbi:MAG: ISAs1 family transposase, partial [Verrucomicrobiota bacterium]